LRRYIKNYFSVVSLVLLCVSRAAATPSGEQREQKTGQAVIRGRVVFADTGRTVRRPVVKLYGDLNHPPVRSTVGNNRGEFRFSEVVAGSYFVMADVAGTVSNLSHFEMSEFGLNSRGTEAEQTRVTVTGAEEKRCQVRVVRANTISGTITYVDREPALSMQIVLFRREQGVTTPLFTQMVETDDRGNYRVEGLPAGEYIVGIKSANPMNVRNRATLTLAYYPGVTSLAAAKTVEVSEGVEAKGISFVLDPGNDFQVSGVTKWRLTGKPVANSILTIRRKDEPKVAVSFSSLFSNITPANADSADTLMRDMSLMALAEGSMIQTSADSKGNFQFQNLSPGTYVINAFGQLSQKEEKKELEEDDAPSFDPDGRLVDQQIEITVGQQDVNDVVVELTIGGRVIGSIVTDEPSSRQFRVALLQPGRSGLLNNIPYNTNADGTFVLEDAPTESMLDVRVSMNSPYYISSMTLGGTDLMREPLRVVEGAEVSGVKIILATGKATVSGRVSLRDGGPATGSGVLLVPIDSKLWHLSSLRVFKLTDANGEFSLSAAPGEYLVFTWLQTQAPAQPLEDFIRANAGAARRITVTRREEKKIDLIATAPRKE
jgi:hypothetical protein